jgi:ribose-phosphate pyrophosphokinase
MMTCEFLVLSGTANPGLAAAMASYLGLPLCARQIERFPDGEISIELQESVRGKEVFLIQPTAPPVDPHLVELLALADACRRAAASRITAVISYFGYARADKRVCRREPVTARMVADLLQTVGIQHVVTLDLHTEQIEGFFTIPVDSLTAAPVLCSALEGRLPDNTVTVAPDAGRARMATEYAHRIGTPVVILHKRRRSGSETETIQLVGDVRGCACLIVDDMIASGGTIVGSIQALLAAGAQPAIWIAATHGLFVDGARAKLAHAAVQEIWVTDTVMQDQQAWPQLHIVSVAPLLADGLMQTHADGCCVKCIEV